MAAKDKTENAAPKSDAPKVTRKMPTAEERVAALKAKLAAAEAAAEAKANKSVNEAKAKRDALVERIAKLQAKVDELNATIGEDSSDASVEPAGDSDTASAES